MSPFYASLRKVLTLGESYPASPCPFHPKVLLITLILVSQPSLAGDWPMRWLLLLCLWSTSCLADDWTTGDTVRQTAFTTLVIADWAQTRWFIKQPTRTICTSGTRLSPSQCTSDSYVETNPILGPNPSSGKANNLTVAAIVGHAAVSYVLPRGWREGWQYVWIGIEAETVHHNRSIGVKFSF